MLRRKILGGRPLMPILVRAYRSARTAVLVTVGLGVVDYGVWQLYHPVGLMAAGVSLLVLDWLADDEPKETAP